MTGNQFRDLAALMALRSVWQDEPAAEVATRCFDLGDAMAREREQRKRGEADEAALRG